MKKRAFAVLLCITALFGFGCGKAPESDKQDFGEMEMNTELICLAESREEAERIAELYGIELIDYAYGTATFRADNPEKTIAEGIENGWPPLEPNEEINAFG